MKSRQTNKRNNFKRISGLLLFSSLLSVQWLSAQSGCTDPQASNYDVAATVNDGSCTYPVTNQALILKSVLPSLLSESSGLVFTDGQLWSNNDSGNPAAIYRVDTSNGSILQTVFIDNYPNTDWEDLTADSAFIYIGDFGNNNATRRDLKVLKIAKASISTDSIVHLDAEAIAFSYADQSSFSSSNAENFDCEALTSVKDSLYLFTKDWGDLKTKVYKLPKTPGLYSVAPYSSFSVDGLITGADYNPSSNEVVLIGYTGNYSESFLWFLNDFTEDLFFSGNKRRIVMSNYHFWQTEGVAFATSNRFFVSCETIGNVDATLYSCREDWEPVLTSSLPISSESNFVLAPNPTTGMVHLLNIEATSSFELFDYSGRRLMNGLLDKGSDGIDLQKLIPGQYHIELTDSKGSRGEASIVKQ
ncbi:MAG: T9SS type A sorting domain-containing protein [Bacteroidetes bacterium]|nr:T9SS type A sorting domain-containing protein [Bacteroidota bacterium]